MHSLKPAVAVMAKVPGATRVKSRLHRSLTVCEATELYRCFLLDRLDALVGLAEIAPVVAFTPPSARARMAELAPPGFRLIPQRGTDLGARLSNLLRGLLRDGHPGAIAIDSDSPTLPMDYVVEGARVLEQDAADLVLGPCDDGGYYFVGLRAHQPQLFTGIPWSTAEVFQLTLTKARRLGLRLHLLPPWFDVDTESDLRRLHEQMVAAGAGPPRTKAFVRRLCG
jgi:uncharacterized protein